MLSQSVSGFEVDVMMSMSVIQAVVLSVAIALACASVALAEPLLLPQGEKIVAPWQTMLSLPEGEVTPDQAAGFRLVDDAKAGRALVVGPWLAGAWYARVQYKKAYPPAATEVSGVYRTVDLLPFTAAVRADFYDAPSKRLATISYPLLPVADWTSFTVRFDKFPVGTARMEFSFGLGQHTGGEVWFAQLETRPAGPHPLADLPAPRLTRPAPPSQQKGTGFWRVERFGEVWWLIDPQGRPDYSRATDPPNPTPTLEQGMAEADKYVGQLRGWGFDGLAGWHSLRLYSRYNQEVRKQGRPPIAQFAVLNYHDCLRHGDYDMLTDHRGRRKDGEHGFPDPFDPRFEAAARKRAEAWAALVRDDPDFVAWFVDNEIGFDDLHRFVWSQHCSRALIAFLRERYPDIASLNKRWGAAYAGYDELAAARPDPPLDRGPMYEDFIAFERRLYQQYVDVTLRVTRQADPRHLIASNRHNLGGLDHWLRNIDLCAGYDLVAVNLYPDNQAPGLGPNALAVLREVGRRSGRPVIIGEWSVPALDSGLYEQKKAVLDWSFPQAVPSHAIRARQAAHIAADFFNEPYVVGAHWFIYADFDSPQREANRGLVRSNGQPWEELVRELAAVHKDMSAATACSLPHAQPKPD
jgi:hypothetical protein